MYMCMQQDHCQEEHPHEGPGLHRLQRYQLRHGGQEAQPRQVTIP